MMINTIIEGFRNASAYQLALFIPTTILATFSHVYIMKRLLTPKFNKYVVFSIIAACYYFDCMFANGQTVGFFNFDKPTFQAVYIILLAVIYVYPLLFRETYIDTMFLLACTQILNNVYLIAYFPFQFLREKYGFDIYIESLCGTTFNFLGVLFAVFIVRKLILPRLDKTPIALKVGLFATYVGMNVIDLIAKDCFSSDYFGDLIVVAIIFTAVTCTAVLLCAKTIKEKEDETKILTAMYYEGDKLEYYRQVEKKNLEIRQLSHDINNHLATIKNLAEKNEDEAITSYVNELSDVFNHASYSYCTNRVADTVLTHEAEYANENGVNLKISAQIPENFFISSVDLVSLISNIIDNAIEASKNSTEKTVSFNSYCDKHSFNMICKNTFAGKIKKNGKKLVSSKKDAQNHGIGVEIIKKLVQKYNGKYNATYSDNEYSVVIYIPV